MIGRETGYTVLQETKQCTVIEHDKKICHPKLLLKHDINRLRITECVSKKLKVFLTLL